MPIILDGTAGIDNNATDLSYTGTLTGGTGVVNLGSGQLFKDASGNVGIGTSSPTTTLHLRAAVCNVRLEDADTSAFANIGVDNSGSMYLQADPANSQANTAIYFATDGSERARINSSGTLLVGTTTAGTYAGLNALLDVVGTTTAASFKNTTAGTQTISVWNATTSGTRFFLEFSDGSTRTTRGSITSNGTSTSYNTSSDYRLKENIVPMTGALAKVALLKPCTYKWKVDGTDGQGFIAHELQEICPDAVTGEKDAVDAEGNPKYQGIDTSFLAGLYAAALQEIKVINDAQAQTIESLNARVVALEQA